MLLSLSLSASHGQDRGVAPPLSADMLLGSNASASQLISFDTETLTGFIVGPIGIGAVVGLTFDNGGTLYGLSVSNPDRLIAIDPVTGVGIPVGPTNVDGDLGAGLANDPVTDRLYAVAGQIGQKFFMEVSKETGDAAVIDLISASVIGLSFDSAGTLWAIDGLTEELVTIDPASGEVTVIGGSLPSAIGALCIGPSGDFWAVESSASAYRLYNISPISGTATLVGELVGVPWAGPMVGLASALSGPPDLCADGDRDGKVTICHVPRGNPRKARTLRVGVSAVVAHLAHGDQCGACELIAPRSIRRSHAPGRSYRDVTRTRRLRSP